VRRRGFAAWRTWASLDRVDRVAPRLEGMMTILPPAGKSAACLDLKGDLDDL
jgi:hypothetical protein